MDARPHERGRQVRARLLSAGAAALAFALAAAAPVAAQPTGRLLVLLDRPQAPRAQAAVVRALAARDGAHPAGPGAAAIGLVVLRPAPGRPAGAVVRALRAQPGVRSVQPEGRMALRPVPNDTALRQPEPAPGTPPGTPLQWAPEHLGLFSGWDRARGADALVGVIDTGVDASHPDFAGKLAAAVDQDDDPSAGPPTVDENGHGSHVSSLACATTGNGVGIAGTGFDCRLVVEKTDLTDSSIARSIVDATDRGARAINMSFGDRGDRPPVNAIVAAIDYAVAHQVVLVAAARDERTDSTGQPMPDQGEPANLLQPAGTGPSLDAGQGLSVTSSTIQDRPSGAGQGTEISLAAPGSMFEFTSRAGPPGLLGVAPAGHAELLDGPLPILSNTCGCRTAVDGATYAYLQGTSMSAPQVAAIAALVRSLNPDLGALDVVRLLKQTARRAAGAGWTPELGWGVVDGGAALAAAAQVDRRPPTSRLRAPARTRARFLRLRWTARDATPPPGVRASGLAYVEVWRAVDRGRARRIARTRRFSLRLRVAPNHRYSFFTIAVDRAGNREAAPARPDAITRVRR